MLTVSSDQHQTPHPQTRSTPTLLRRADEMLERGRLACGSFITIVMGTLLRAGCDVLREQAPGTHGLVPASEDRCSKEWRGLATLYARSASRPACWELAAKARTGHPAVIRGWPKWIGRCGALLPLFRLVGVPCIAALWRVKSLLRHRSDRPKLETEFFKVALALTTPK